MSPEVKQEAAELDAAPIDGTDEARARAAAAREVAKRKHEEVVKPEEPRPAGKKSKKTVLRTSTSTHTVAVPDGYQPDAQRDAAIHGELGEAAVGGSSGLLVAGASKDCVARSTVVQDSRCRRTRAHLLQD